MCGIAGFWTQTGELGDARERLARMTCAVHHRGPDDEGRWCDDAHGIALGHRRLSILDVSPLGHQPMTSVSGRWVIIYNGEIYNFAEIRAELEATGERFRGHSDTEVFLAAVERWGVERAVERSAGMFAIALWDRERRELHLARDRMGEKPLYHGWAGGTLLFGSELKALRAHPAWRGVVDRDVLALYMRHNYVPGPYSIFAGIGKVVPGTLVTYRADAPGAAPRVTTYWSAAEAAARGFAEPFDGTPDEAADELDALLHRVIGDEMVSDVPLGAFLSGGIDSSTVVAVMQALSDRPVRTFTIGFHEAHYNEAAHAKAVAHHLGTDHTELYVTPRETLDVIPLLPSMYCEPFADSSQIPTHLVARLARQHVTVSLSGDGGDELFAGYSRYFIGEQLWRKAARLPRPVRAAVASGLTAVPARRWTRLFDALPTRRRIAFAGEKMHRLARLLQPDSHQAMYRDLISQWMSPEDVVLGSHEPPTALTSPDPLPPPATRIDRMAYLDQVSYLPDDIMVKVDRASMAVSLEARAPFLDHRVVELAWRMPMALKVRDGVGKQPLRRVLDRYVPRDLIERPKMGFGVPVGEWLRGELRDWAEGLLAPERLRRDGYLDPALVTLTWRQHQERSHDWHYRLWPVLMFQAWLGEQ
ncbi:MAG TPA: asparagine synthase (glutamine-hydrolyzing) [Gemmatimonadaceae bacterium]|nr:asparagine synthase (glutamine-hydrolyzing) [Gemmatimonadaceae bacterium]